MRRQPHLERPHCLRRPHAFQPLLPQLAPLGSRLQARLSRLLSCCLSLSPVCLCCLALGLRMPVLLLQLLLLPLHIGVCLLQLTVACRQLL
jgi:hypothetical protein